MKQHTNAAKECFRLHTAFIAKHSGGADVAVMQKFLVAFGFTSSYTNVIRIVPVLSTFLIKAV
jgi:hypothetical protein